MAKGQRICIRPNHGTLRLEQYGGRRPSPVVTRDWRSAPKDWWTPFYMARSYCGKSVGRLRVKGRNRTIVEIRNRHYATDPRETFRR